jgi:hypothetical protein
MRASRIPGAFAFALLLRPAGAGAAPPPVSVTVPVVLDVYGVAPAHYTSDLVLVNRGAAPTRVTLAYRPAPGTPGAGTAPVADSVGAGRELRIPDVIQYLRDHAAPIPASGPAIVGSLGVTFLDVTDPSLVFAGSRASTPNPDAAVGGSFGLFAPAVSGSGSSGPLTVFGLREDAAFRSNLAVVDLPGGSGPAVLAIQVWDGDTGLPAGAPVPYELQPGDFHQFNSVLGLRGVTNGWATVTQTGGGTDAFTVYGVVNDGSASGGGTSDGSFIAPGGTDGGLVPIVLRVPSAGSAYTSELILANPSAGTVKTTLTYTPSSQLASGAPVSTVVSVPAGRQLRFADLVTTLGTTLGLSIPQVESQGGTLVVSPGVAALVRTSIPNADARVGGTFGVAYPAFAPPARAATDAWVYGLRQDASARSNLAIADARAGDPTSVSYLVDLYDSANGNGTPAATLGPYALAGGQWMQVSAVLASAGLATAYARVHPTGGTSDFVAYGVVNDGSAPGRGTSDGSYVAALPVPPPVVLTYVPGSSVKVEQVIGDCDWSDVPYGTSGTCHEPTPSQTITRAKVLGTDISYSWEANGKLMFVFGDTLGANVDFHGHDPIAWSSSTDPDAGLVVNFYVQGDGTPLFVEPPGVKMGGFDVPNSGITLADGTYVVCNTGADGSLPDVHQNAYSILAKFDEGTQTFTTGRTISSLPGGHFVFDALHASGTDVFTFGFGAYRASDVYLARTPAAGFWMGAGAQVFAGLVNGVPTWSDQESAAVPVVIDNPLHVLPPDPPTIGGVSVAWSADLGLWLMTYDGGRNLGTTTGIWFTYAEQPWGPWSAPQLVFNATRDGAYGSYIHLPGHVPPGPAGPVTANADAASTPGGVYAPELIERFTRVAGDTLTISWTMATWNPYTVVRMKSSFRIARSP